MLDVDQSGREIDRAIVGSRGPRARIVRGAHSEAGLVLTATIIVLALLSVLIAVAVRAAITSVRAAGLDYHEARVFYAAEAGGEAGLSQLLPALADGHLADSELAAIGPPSLPGFSYDSFSVAPRDTTVVEQITDGPFTGLYAFTQNVEIYSLASDPARNAAAVVLRAKAQAIPIFQFGVFFEQDLEATNGPPLDFVGRVHSNGNIYLSSANAWYHDMITTPNEVYHDRKDHHDVLNGVFIHDAAGNPVALSFDSRSIPGSDAFKTASCSDFDCRLQTDAFSVESLDLPLPSGVPPLDLVRPRIPGDSPAQRSVKFAWNADTYVTVDLTNLRTELDLCGSGPSDVWWPNIRVQRTGGPSPSTAEVCRIFQWEWSAFYDGREDELKDVLTFDIRELATWVGGGMNRRTEIVYVEFIPEANVNNLTADARNEILDAAVQPALRLKRGSLLPGRMTVATEWPVYVEGDYNSKPKRPAAVVGDAITILSENWDDDQNRPPDSTFDGCAGLVVAGGPCPGYLTWKSTWSSRPAAETTVNAAILAGHWPTPCDHHDATCPADGSASYYADWYGGGIENFPRFLEDWRYPGGGRVVFRYRGSMVSLFTSNKTTGTWNPSHYGPPQREWSFDTDFRNPALLPPGTPNVGNVVRTAMREAF